MWSVFAVISHVFVKNVYPQTVWYTLQVFIFTVFQILRSLIVSSKSSVYLFLSFT